MTPRCADCRHVTDEREPGENEPSYRCGMSVPFWVPLPVHDYQSWVKPDDGAKCRTFQIKE